MSLSITLIAKLSRVETALARRAWNTIGALDEPSMKPPSEFRSAEGARCYALASYVRASPGQFYLGLAGLIGFPSVMVFKYGYAWCEWAVRYGHHLLVLAGMTHG